MDKIREIALKTLYNVDKNEAYSTIALDEAINEAKEKMQKIEDRDIAFISEIVYGTITWRLTIDEIIQKYSNIKIKKISPWILNILRMSIYQIVFLDKVPKSAAVNEGVNLAKRYGHKASSNFVNAILRKVEKQDYKDFFEIKDYKERISKTTSMPMWIIEELLKDNSQEEVEEICVHSNLRPKLTIRVNTLKTTKQEFCKELEDQNIKFEELPCEGIRNIENNKSFQEGKFTIEDEAAGLIPIILKPNAREKVLDACSSPRRKNNLYGTINE